MVHMDRLGHSLGADVHIELHLTTPRLRATARWGPLCTSKVHPISHPDDLLSTHGEVCVNHPGWVARRTAFVRFRDLIIYAPFPSANLTDPAPVFAFQLPTMGHIGAAECYSARWALQCRELVGSGEVTMYHFR